MSVDVVWFVHLLITMWLGGLVMRSFKQFLVHLKVVFRVRLAPSDRGKGPEHAERAIFMRNIWVSEIDIRVLE